MPATQTVSDYEKERGKPPPSWNHGITQAHLIVALAQYEPDCTVLSELTLDLEGLPSNTTPDISIYGPTTTDYTHDPLRVAEPPLVAVWIASPPESTQDVVNKIHGLLGAGVRSCWLVQPATRSITVYGPDMQPRTFSGDDTVEEPVLDGVEVGVNEVFGEA
jgi:Uma2 family endonuclease